MKLFGICFSGTRDGESVNTGSGPERLVYTSLQIVESGWTEFGSMMRSQMCDRDAPDGPGVHCMIRRVGDRCEGKMSRQEAG